MKFKLSFPVWFRDFFFIWFVFFSLTHSKRVELIALIWYWIYLCTFFNLMSECEAIIKFKVHFISSNKMNHRYLIFQWFFFFFSFQIKSNPENASIITILVWVKSDESVLNRRAAAWARERAVWWHAIKHIRPSILWQKPTFSTVRRQHKCERTQKKCCSI